MFICQFDGSTCQTIWRGSVNLCERTSVIYLQIVPEIILMYSIPEKLWRANFVVIHWKCNLVWKYDCRICRQRWVSILRKSVVRPIAYSASLNKLKDWTTGNVIRSPWVVLVFESAGRTGFPIPVRVKDFIFCKRSGLVLGRNQPIMWWVTGILPRGKTIRAWS